MCKKMGQNSSSGFSYVHTSSSPGGEGKGCAATIDPCSGVSTDRVTGTVKKKTKGGIHSVQLVHVPSFTNEGLLACNFTCSAL